MNKVLVDTNILIYSIDEDSKYFKKSQEILFNENNDLYTTSKNLIEFLTVITRLPHSLSLSTKQALEVINDFRKELKSFKLSDNTMQFPLGNPMPKEIVVKLAAFY